MRNKKLALTITLILSVQLSGCGLILHPERKGQTGGNLDPAIVALDAAGLLLFIVPGLVSFGVDFYYGTIYLPGTAMTLDENELNSLRYADEHTRAEELAKLVAQQTGQEFEAEQMISYEVNSVEELTSALTRVNQYQTGN